jgi:uncharacterized protein YndB with AHSA1/START domain
MPDRTIRQTVTLPATPSAVYTALMDPKQHAAFTGDKAVISAKVGAAFSVFGGYASGKNLELVPGKRIVQTWRADDWPTGKESKVTFGLAPVKGGTKLTFVQTGVPAQFVADIKQGWIDYYWEPMKTYLAGKAKKR